MDEFEEYMTEEPLEIKSLTTMEGAEQFVNAINKVTNQMKEAVDFIKEHTFQSDLEFAERVCGMGDGIGAVADFILSTLKLRIEVGIDDTIRENADILPPHAVASLEINKNFATSLKASLATMNEYMATRILPDFFLKADAILPNELKEMKILKAGVVELFGEDCLLVRAGSVLAIELDKLREIFGKDRETGKAL